jgi:methionine-rich copper-binding protein CopC
MKTTSFTLSPFWSHFIFSGVAIFVFTVNSFAQSVSFSSVTVPASMEFTPAAGNGAVQMADINGDGYPDIIYIATAGGPITYLQNDGTGVFSTPSPNPFSAYTTTTPAGLTFNASTSIADFDGDGDLDIWCRVGGAANDVYLRNDNGTYVTVAVPPGMEYTPAGGSSAVQVADLNGDGYPDIIYVETAGGPITYLQNNGSGSFSTPSSNPFAAFTVSSPAALTFNGSTSIADFDGDGDMDIWCRVGGAANDIYLQNNSGTFVSAIIPTGMEYVPAGGAAAVQVADLNDDGYVDIIYNAGSGTAITYLQNNGSGSFSTPSPNPFASFTSSSPSGLNFNTSVSISDVDGDGDFDIWCRIGGASNDILLKAGGFAPKLVSSSPANNSTNVAETSNIVLTFNEAVTAGAGNIYIKNLSTNAIVETIAANSVNVTGSGSTIITINPPADLSGNTSYYITFDRNALVNANGVIVGNINILNKVIDPITKSCFLSFSTSGALALQFLSFQAYASGTAVQTKWTTANESGISNYAIEKSSDGVTFSKAAQIAADNKASNLYNWIDINPFSGNNFYRVEIINTDGTFAYSNIISVQADITVSSVKIYPNPSVSHTFIVQLPDAAKNEPSYLSVYNEAGTLVLQQEFAGGPSSAHFVTLAPTITAGVYVVSVTKHNKSRFSVQILVE